MTKYVAIAGGTSPGLGRSLTTAIIKHYPGPSPEWHPILLSRSSKPPPWTLTLPPGSFTFVPSLSYTSGSPSLQSALKGVHTVISVILAKDGTHETSQLALLEAARKTPGMKRVVSSEWASGIVGMSKVGMLRTAKEGLWNEFEKERARVDGLEVSRFNVGCFMNYLGIGCGKFQGRNRRVSNEEDGKAIEHVACAGVDREGDMSDGSGSFLISMGGEMAEIPIRDDGQWPRITLTEIGNVGEL